jgi:hypothetical protein
MKNSLHYLTIQRLLWHIVKTPINQPVLWDKQTGPRFNDPILGTDPVGEYSSEQHLSNSMLHVIKYHKGCNWIKINWLIQSIS